MNKIIRNYFEKILNKKMEGPEVCDTLIDLLSKIWFINSLIKIQMLEKISKKYCFIVFLGGNFKRISISIKTQGRIAISR